MWTTGRLRRRPWGRAAGHPCPAGGTRTRRRAWTPGGTASRRRPTRHPCLAIWACRDIIRRTSSAARPKVLTDSSHLWHRPLALAAHERTFVRAGLWPHFAAREG